MAVQILPFLFLLALSAWPARAGEPAVPTGEAAPRAEAPILNEVFRSQFNEEQLSQFQKSPTLDDLARQMSPEQRQAARAQLGEREAQAKNPEELQEIARGYLLLGGSEDAVRIASQLLEENPGNVKAHHLTSEAQYNLRNFPAAAEAAKAALKINPNDRVALAHWMLTKGRVSTANVKLPTDPFEKKEGGGNATQRQAGNSDANQSITAVVAKSVLSNLPTPPAPVDTTSLPPDATLADIAKMTFVAAATATGGLLLFMGLGAGKLEEHFPHIRRNLGIAAGVSGLVAVSAASLPTIAPLVLSNPPAMERARNAIASVGTPQGQRLVVQVEQQLPQSVRQGALLKEHLRQLQKYGEAGFKELENGRIRYYGHMTPAETPGKMAGRRLVREWDPLTNSYRTWHETLDWLGMVRRVRPEAGQTKAHYNFNSVGEYVGKN